MGRFFDFKVTVYYSDTDSYGVAWHGSYIRWFEMARVELLRSEGVDAKKFSQADITLPVVEMDSQFKKSAFLDESLTIRTYIREMTALKIIFYYEVLNSENIVIATGGTTLVAVNKEGKLYRRLPEALQAACRPYL